MSRKQIKASQFLSVLLACMVLSAPANAKGPRIVPGDEAQQRVAALTSQIHWHGNLEQAKAEARRTNKMILWVQMLGKLDGTT